MPIILENKYHSSTYQPIDRPPVVSSLDQLQEFRYLTMTKFQVILAEPAASSNPSSTSTSIVRRPPTEKGQFTYFYIEPLFLWWGRNLRIINTKSLGVVQVSNDSGETITAVNGASHNYAGFYKPTPAEEELQRLALEMLPVTETDNMPVLRDAVHKAIAEFLGTDFCFTTATGYGANYVAFPPLVESNRTAVILDTDCHNSMYTGAFLGQSKNLWRFKHNNVKHLEEILRAVVGRFDTVIVVTEGLYSMEGDVPPLSGLHKLKNEYNFVLLCDEAHSFLSLGSTGRGCIEHWNELYPDDPVPLDLIDIRTATLSKAIGGIGGIIAGKAEFKPTIERHVVETLGRNSEVLALPTSTMVQTLAVLNQPARTRRNLERLAAIAKFCRSELARAGVFVYGSKGTPVLPIWTGRLSKAAALSYELRRCGLLASFVTTPAVPFWESRVRVNLSADYTDADVDKLVSAIITATKKLGIQRKPNGPRHVAVTPSFASLGMPGLAYLDEDVPEEKRTVELVTELVRCAAATCASSCAQTAIAAGHASRLQYGIGSGSSRWISGTFPTHLALEKLIARRTGTETAMMYPDGAIGLASTVAALSRPPKEGLARHCFFYPSAAEGFVKDGLRMGAPTKMGVQTNLFAAYRNVDTLVGEIRSGKWGGGKGEEVACTIYVKVVADDCHESDVCAIKVSRLSGFVQELAVCSAKLRGVLTLLIHASSHIIDSSELGKLDPDVHVLVYGSLMPLCQLPGGYLAGPEWLIKELRYTSRGYMFTTSNPPFVMSMACAMLDDESKAKL